MQQGLIETLEVDALPLSDMIQKREEIQPISPFERLPGPPTNPGLYWFKGDTAWREMLVQVRLINGQLTMQRFYRDHIPVAAAKGHWRGPLRPCHRPLNK